MDRRLKFAGVALAGLLALGAGGVAVASMNDGPGRFGRADANNDGQITRAEWIQAATARFDKFDLNKDSKLTTDEMPRRHGHHRHGPHRGGPDGGRGGPDWDRGGPPPPPPGTPEPGATAMPTPSPQQ